MDTTGTSTTAARVAENQASFRVANEAIQGKAAEWDMDGLLPVICECADASCTEVLQLAAAEYEDIRANPRRFINAPGHHVRAQGWATVVAEREGYVIAEKIGEAGEIAEELDPRSV